MSLLPLPGIVRARMDFFYGYHPSFNVYMGLSNYPWTSNYSDYWWCAKCGRHVLWEYATCFCGFTPSPTFPTPSF